MLASNWKNTGKRGLALFLALLMCVDLLSLTALAVESDEVTAAKETLTEAKAAYDTARADYEAKEKAYGEAFTAWETAPEADLTGQTDPENEPDAAEDPLGQAADAAKTAMDEAKAAMDEAEARVEVAQAELDRLLAAQAQADDADPGEDTVAQGAPGVMYAAQEADGDAQEPPVPALPDSKMWAYVSADGNWGLGTESHELKLYKVTDTSAATGTAAASIEDGGLYLIGDPDPKNRNDTYTLMYAQPAATDSCGHNGASVPGDSYTLTTGCSNHKTNHMFRLTRDNDGWYKIQSVSNNKYLSAGSCTVGTYNHIPFGDAATKFAVVKGSGNGMFTIAAAVDAPDTPEPDPTLPGSKMWAYVNYTTVWGMSADSYSLKLYKMNSTTGTAADRIENGTYLICAPTTTNNSAPRWMHVDSGANKDRTNQCSAGNSVPGDTVTTSDTAHQFVFTVDDEGWYTIRSAANTAEVRYLNTCATIPSNNQIPLSATPTKFAVVKAEGNGMFTIAAAVDDPNAPPPPPPVPENIRVTDASGTAINLEDGTYTIPAGGKIYSGDAAEPFAVIPMGVTSVTVSEDAAKTLTVGENGVMSLSENAILLPDGTPTASVTAAGSCGESVYFAVTGEGKLVISGTGAMADHTSGKAPWYTPTVRNDLTELVVMDGVTGIGNYAFYYCGFTQVSLPDSVTSIGDYSFAYCRKLTGITVPDSLTHMGKYAFRFCDELRSFRIPSGITYVPEAAFWECKKLETVELHSGVTEIRANAFMTCQKLNSLTAGSDAPGAVTIPASVTTIGTQAFRGCNALTHVTIANPDAVIGDQYTGAFMYCKGLVSIDLPANMKGTLSNNAFEQCSALESIVIPDGITTIGNKAFEQCVGLKTVVLPKSLQQINTNAFYNCYSLTGVIFTGEASPTISGAAFSIYNTSTKYLYAVVVMNDHTVSLTGLKDPADLTRVLYVSDVSHTSALSNNVGTYKAVLNGGSIPKGTIFQENKLITPVKAGYTFQGWYNGDTPLTKDAEGDTYTIPADATAGTTYTAHWAEPVAYTAVTAGGAAIEAVDGIFTIPAGGKVMYGGQIHFTVPMGVKDIRVPAAKAGELALGENGSAVLEGMTVVMPNGDEAAELIGSGQCGDSVYYALVKDPSSTAKTTYTRMHVSGNGPMWDMYTSERYADIYPGRLRPYQSLASNIKWAKVYDGVTTIGDYAFCDANLASGITLPTTLNTIGREAFTRVKMSQISIPEGVTSIGVRAFYAAGQAYLKGFGGNPDTPAKFDVTLPSTLTELGNYAFGYSHMTQITVPEGVKVIPEYAFYECKDLKTVTTLGATEIGASAFAASGASESATLVTITLPESLATIGNRAFKSPKVTKLTIPASVQTIGSDVFHARVSQLEFKGQPETIASDAFPTMQIANNVGTITGIAVIYVANSEALAKLQSVGISGHYVLANLNGHTLGDRYTAAASLAEALKADGTADTWYDGSGNPLEKNSTYGYSSIPNGVDVTPGSVFTAGKLGPTVTVTTAADVPIPAVDSTYTIPAGGKVCVDGELTFTAPMGIKEMRVPADKAAELKARDHVPEKGEKVNEKGIIDGIDGVTFVMPDGTVTTALLGSGEVGATAYYAITAEGCAFVSGTGPMDKSFITYSVTANSPPFMGNNKVTSAVICEGVTTIGPYLFKDASMLRSVSVPASVIEIGRNAFEHCTQLADVQFARSSGLTTIGARAFKECYALRTIELPAVTELGAYCFQNSGIHEFTIPDRLVYIPTGGFRDCASLVSISGLDHVNMIQDLAFSGYVNIRVLEIPENVSQIGYQVFADSNIKHIVIHGENTEVRGTGSGTLQKSSFFGLGARVTTSGEKVPAIVYVDSEAAYRKVAPGFEDAKGACYVADLNGYTVDGYLDGGILAEPKKAGFAGAWYDANGMILERDADGNFVIPADTATGAVFTAGELKAAVTVVTANGETINAVAGTYTIPAGGKVMRGSEILFTVPMGVTCISVPETSVEQLTLGDGGAVAAIDGMTIALPDGTTTTSLSKSGSCGKAENDAVYFVTTTENKVVISGSGEMADYSNTYHNTFGYTIRSATVMPGVTSIGAYAFAGKH